MMLCNVNRAEIAEFRAAGHLVLRNAVSREAITRVLDVISDVLQTYCGEIERPRNLWRRSPEIAQIIFNEGLGEIAADFLGVDRVRLIHDAMFEKIGTAPPTPWHHDSHFWNFEGAGALTFWVPLQETLPSQALSYVSRSHRDRDQRLLNRFEKAAIPLRHRVTRAALALGDVTVHHYRTLHASTRYHTDTLRRALTIHVIDANARLLEAQNPYQVQHNVSCGWDRIAVGGMLSDEIAPLMFARNAAELVAV
jgi:hypothetical protein